MTPEERTAYVEESQRTRAEIQERISRLRAEREDYVAEQRAAAGDSSATALDAAMIAALRAQAAEKDFVLE